MGALEAFESKGLRPRRVVGTSAGAITATLLAAGYTADKMRAALEEEQDGKPVFATFMGPPKEGEFAKEDVEQSLTMNLFRATDLPAVPDWLEKRIDRALIEQLLKIPIYRTLFSFVERGGLYAGNAFVEWFRGKLDEQQDGLADMTLAEFARETDSDLSLVASDTTGRDLLVLNHRSAPNCPVAWAVRSR